MKTRTYSPTILTTILSNERFKTTWIVKGFLHYGARKNIPFILALPLMMTMTRSKIIFKRALSSEKVSLNIGHRALAALLEMEQARIVFTTNFDDVIETAYAEVGGKNITPFHLEGSYAALAALNAERFPIYAKIHGDFRYKSIKNLESRLAQQ